jgi:hypothetical protein
MLGVRWLIDTGKRKHSLVATVLSAVSLCATGIPVLPYVAKDLSTPFPCQNHACGCSDADYCWRYCGCHTVAEKLAWAREHNVTPPKHYLDRVNVGAGWAASGPDNQPNEEVCHCCRHAETATDSDRVDHVAARRNSSANSVILISEYRNCRGIAGAFGVFCSIICAPLPEPWRPENESPGQVVVAELEWVSVRLSPPSPPPRQAGSSSISEIRGIV